MRGVVATIAWILALMVAAPRVLAQAPRAGQGEPKRWGDERTLSSGLEPVDLAYNFARAISVDDAGRVHVVWAERHADKDRLFYRRSTDGGAVWRPEVCLSDVSEPMPQDPLLPAVATTGDHVFVSWHERGSGGINVFFRCSHDGGQLWQPAVRLSGKSGAAAHTSIAASGSLVHVVWGDHRDGDQTEIYYTRSADHGATWEPERRLTDLPYDSWVPSLSAMGDTVVLGWVDTRDGNEEEYVRISRDGGRSWGPQTRLTRDRAKSWAPSVAVSGSTIHIAWFDQKDAPFQPPDAEAKLDEVLKRLGLPVEPVPQGIRVPHPEAAAKKRVSEKLHAIHDAAPDWVAKGGNPAKLQAIMKEFDALAEPTGLMKTDAKLDEALRLVGLEPMNGDLPRVPEGWQSRFRAKIKRIEETAPGWVKKGGDEAKLRAVMDQVGPLLSRAGGASFAEKEQKLDEAMRLLGLTYHPGPGDDLSTIYNTEALAMRVQEKMRRVQAAAPRWIEQGGDRHELETLIHKFERRMKPASVEWDLYYLRSTDDGATWEPEVRLTNAPGLSHRPSIVADGTDVYLTWWDNRDGNNEVYFKHSSDGGKTWRSDVRLSRAEGDSVKPSLAVSPEFLHILWVDARDGDPQLYYRRIPRAAVD